MPVINTQIKTLVFSNALQILIGDENVIDYPKVGEFLAKKSQEIRLGQLITI
jgi:hypothetical protein